MSDDGLLADPVVLQAIRAGVMVSTVGGHRTYAYVGRKVPKGWREMAGAIHLGRGQWLFRVEPLATASERSEVTRPGRRGAGR